jgi:hypothetical protein
MEWSIDNPPPWLAGLPPSAISMALSVYAASLAAAPDDSQAQRAAMCVVDAVWAQGEHGWVKKSPGGGDHQETIHFQAARQADTTGLVWEVVIIAPGLGLGSPRFYWGEEVLQAAVADKIFDGVDINAYELTTDFFSHLRIPDMGLLEDVKRFLSSRKVGWIERTWWEPEGIKALIKFLPDQAWLPRTIQHGIEQGNQNVLGLSIDARIRGFNVMVDSQPVCLATQIVSASSVDVVTHPAAGGKFIRAVAGLMRQENVMNRAKLLAMINKQRPDLLAGIDQATITDEAILQLAQQAMTPKPAAQDQAGAGQQAQQGLTLEQVKTLVADETKVVEQRAACGRMLDVTLGASQLPEPTQTRIRERFTGSIFDQAALDTAVKGEKEYLAQMGGMPAFNLGDQGRAQVGLSTAGKIGAAVDLMFGITPQANTDLSALRTLYHEPTFEARAAQDYDGVPRLTGLRELYVLLTGDGDISGRFNRDGLSADLRAAQDITSATFSFALGNTMSRRLVMDYRATDFQEGLLITTRKPVVNFKQQEAVNVGYFGDLDTVDPETGDYEEITGVTDEEATYTIGQKGNILTVTRKLIMNDDLSVLPRLVSRLGRSARRTHAKYVWGLWINNTNCSDGTAWFTAGHGNLGSAALSFATALTGYLALAKMTEMDSGERIGLLDGGVKPVLVYPVDLMATAEKIINDDDYYSSNDLTTKTRNPLKGKITGAQLSLLTDANNWGLLLPPTEADMIEMGYINGRQDPEMFLADSPQSEQVFVADKTRYKVRHEYAGTVIDFRTGYKAEVA